MSHALVSVIVERLSTARPLAGQVLEALMSQYQQTDDLVPAFLTQTLQTLDDTAIDLLMSPAFTPTMEDRKACIAVLKQNALTTEQQQALLADVIAANPTMTAILPDDTSVTFPIPDVNLMRFVRLLQLTRPEDAEIFARIEELISTEQDKALYHVLARDAAWTDKTTILHGFLPVLAQQPANTMVLLTNFVRTYRPNSFSELDRQLESYIRSCESDLNRAGELSFHDVRLKEKYVLHGEGDTTHHMQHQMKHEEDVKANYLQMMDQGRLLRDLLQHVDAQTTRG
jgi:hypothetical protein